MLYMPRRSWVNFRIGKIIKSMLMSQSDKSVSDIYQMDIELSIFTKRPQNLADHHW